MKAILFFCILLIFAAYVQAQDSPYTFNSDRPGQCYSPITVSKGYLTLESGLSLDIMSGINQWGLAVHDFRYGLVNNLELKVGVRTFLSQLKGTDDPVMDASLMSGLKWGIVNKKIQLAYVAEVYIPIFPTLVSAQHALNMSHSVGKKVSFSYMFLHQYNFEYLPFKDYIGGLQFSYLSSFALYDDWAFYVEFSGRWDNSGKTQIQVLYDAGITYMPKDNLQIDVYFGQGLNYSNAIFGLGLSWLPLKKKQQPKLH